MGTTTSNSASTLKPNIVATNPAQAFESTHSHSSTHRLPDQPLVTIVPTGTWDTLSPGDLWAHRELLYFLIWRDIKVRYKQTVLGLAWVAMQPLLLTIIFTVFLGILARVPSDTVPYPLLVYVGLLPWTFFSSAVMSSGTSLVSNSHLITKVYFPRIIIPAAAVGGRLIDMAISFVILIGLMVYYRVGLTLNVLMLPVLVALTTMLALGVGTLISALNVKYRDIGVMLPVLVQLWMFVSPVIYPSSLLPAKWRWVYSLNPLVGIIDGFRASLFGGAFDRFALLASLAATIILLAASVYIFRRVERSFADII
jgi:lipopolysaccharide transport system permease protein